jgi:hypothetical protein
MTNAHRILATKVKTTGNKTHQQPSHRAAVCLAVRTQNKEKVMKQQSDGKLYHPTRRGFIQSGTALGLLGASGLALSSGRAHAQTPKTGGHFSIAMTGSATTDTLDPRAAQNDMVYTLLLNVHAYLVDVSPNNELVPELASTWTADPDTSRWIFDLNPDAKFHNGKPVTSADVLATIAFHTAEDSESGMKSQLSTITEMKADGPNRVIMQLASRPFQRLSHGHHAGRRRRDRLAKRYRGRCLQVGRVRARHIGKAESQHGKLAPRPGLGRYHRD